MGVTVPFPEDLPQGYAWFEDEPAFDAARHLALEIPTEIVMLSDLGYDEVEIARTAPVIAALRAQGSVPISIDTRKAVVARAALDAGKKYIDSQNISADG